MIKAGIFLDMENLSRCGGWGMNVDVVRRLVEIQGATVIRANAYMAIDEERERNPEQREYARKKEGFREALRRNGFHVVLKSLRRFQNADGSTSLKANADIELAVDALLQSQQLDYILLGTGDGDFIRLVRALQNRGKRVDCLGFSFVSGELRREVDYFFNGYLVPGLLECKGPPGSERHRGYMHAVDEERGFAFLTYATGHKHGEEDSSLFLHIRDLEGGRMNNEEFAYLCRRRDTYIEFEIDRSGEKLRAHRASLFMAPGAEPLRPREKDEQAGGESAPAAETPPDGES
ncbi:MAG: NYN domain-containing protein [Deltaproteobacteria bacterium]|nr:NYN domain-containing protein [Deltaproteobacteria bacterium]